jgi:uncharacterized protein (TIGR03437 family)
VLCRLETPPVTNLRKGGAGVWLLACLFDGMRWKLLVCLALAGCAGAQTSSPTQPWATTGQWSTPVIQGTLSGPLAVDSSGDLVVANTLVGFSAPTKILGSTSAGSSYLSKMSASGVPVFGVQVGGVPYLYLIAVDSAGDVLIGGDGLAGGLPVTPNAYSSTPSGPSPTFACKLNGADGTPAFCTYLNSDQISIDGIGADASGNVYVLAIDLMQSIVPTPGALSLGSRDVVLLKLDPTGQNLLYAAAFGGNGAEGLLNLSVDADGNAYVMGVTSSTNFPGAANGAIPTPSSSFIAKVDPTGSKIIYASYGGAQEIPMALAVDPSGAAYVSGTASTGELYVRKYTADGTAVAYETVLAGSAGNVEGVAVDSTGILTMFGTTESVSFPQRFSIMACPALTAGYPAIFPEYYMVRLAADGSILQSTFFPDQLVFTPAADSSILSIQPDHGWLAFSTTNPTGVGVVQIGPDSAPLYSVSIGCISNGASFAPGSIAAGEIISVFGGGLGPEIPQTFTLDSNGRIASTLAGVQVTFDGTPAPLLYVQDAQINAITPWELIGKTTTEMCVVYNGNKGCVTPAVAVAAIGVFASAENNAIALNQDGTLNSSTHPAPVGSVISLYVTGLGPISPTPADGAIVQLPLPTLVYPIQVLFTDTSPYLPPIPPAEVLYAGPAPLEVGGLFQINVRIPSETTGGGFIILVVPVLSGGTGSLAANVFITPLTPSASEPQDVRPAMPGARMDRVP